MNGKKIKEQRLLKGLTQIEFAKRIGVSQAMISQLENGCRNTISDTFEMIAKELGMPYEELYGEPPVFVQLMRNCKKLSNDQLFAINEMIIKLTNTI